MIDVTIEQSGTDSTVADIRNERPRGVAVVVGSAWTSADIYIEVSNDQSAWYRLKNDAGSDVAISGIATSAAGYYTAPAESWMIGPWAYMRLVASAAQSGGDRTLTIVLVS